MKSFKYIFVSRPKKTEIFGRLQIYRIRFLKIFKKFRLTLKMWFSQIFMVIFVFSTSKYVNIRNLNQIGSMRFSDVYPNFPESAQSFYLPSSTKNVHIRKSITALRPLSKPECYGSLVQHLFSDTLLKIFGNFYA